MTEEQLYEMAVDNLHMMRTLLSSAKDIFDSLCKNDEDMECLRTPWLNCYMSIASFRRAADELFNKNEEE